MTKISCSEPKKKEDLHKSYNHDIHINKTHVICEYDTVLKKNSKELFRIIYEKNFNSLKR